LNSKKSLFSQKEEKKNNFITREKQVFPNSLPVVKEVDTSKANKKESVLIGKDK
jgi:hypothetical protein